MNLPKIPSVGRRVVYVRPDGTVTDAWIDAVRSDGSCELRITRTAAPDVRVKWVSFSEVPRANCWSWRGTR